MGWILMMIKAKSRETYLLPFVTMMHYAHKFLNDYGSCKSVMEEL